MDAADTPLKREQLREDQVQTPFREFVRKFKKQKTAVIALIVLIILAILAIFADIIAPYEINEYNYAHVLEEPTPTFIFGTDEFGRDIFSRIIHGTRISLSIGFFSVSIAAIIGSFLGMLAGYYGGLLDALIMRISDVLFAFPGLILAIAIVAILGPGLYNVVIAVIIFRIPTFARLVRSTTLATKGAMHVLAARSLGASDMRLLMKHILPDAIPNITVQYSISIGGSIMTAASLSFLGMGAAPPTPEWGLMLSNARAFVFTDWHYAFFPGLAIFITVLCFNLLGDGLRSALDPKLSD